jgi:hypothetical protein
VRRLPSRHHMHEHRGVYGHKSSGEGAKRPTAAAASLSAAHGTRVCHHVALGQYSRFQQRAPRVPERLIPAPMNPCAFCSRAFDGDLGCRCHLHSYLSDLVSYMQRVILHLFCGILLCDFL